MALWQNLFLKFLIKEVYGAFYIGHSRIFLIKICAWTKAVSKVWTPINPYLVGQVCPDRYALTGTFCPSTTFYPEPHKMVLSDPKPISVSKFEKTWPNTISETNIFFCSYIIKHDIIYFSKLKIITFVFFRDKTNIIYLHAFANFVCKMNIKTWMKCANWWWWNRSFQVFHCSMHLICL